MYESAKKFDDGNSVFNGFILLDKMSIQEDLQVVKCGENWELIRTIHLGPLVNNLEMISDQKKTMQLATHCFQFMCQAVGGFR